jgi:hypothetical protein
MLRDILNDEEMAALQTCINGDDDLYLDHYDLFSKLIRYYADEIPIGVQKGRTGDPDDWILARADRDLTLEKGGRK